MTYIESPEIPILFEDTRFLVVNKPADIAVHGGSGISLGIIEKLRSLRPNAPYLELAHRLDKPTSGCLVIAKRRSALRAFQKQQAQRGVDKHYLALLQGEWQGTHRKVDAPLLKIALQPNGWIVHVDAKGKRAVSYFLPIQRFKGATLMRIKLITGRTHQIRVHAQHINHPIAGDTKYGKQNFNQTMLQLGLNRLCLHAESIRFTLPNIPPYLIQAPADWSLSSLSAMSPSQSV